MFALILATAVLSPANFQPVEPTPAPAPVVAVSVEHIEQRDALLVTAALVLVFVGTALLIVKA